MSFAVRAQIAAAEFIDASATNSALSPDFLLAAACCRWPPSGHRLAAIRAAAKNIADWGSFLQVVKRQRVAVAVWEALRSAGVESPATVAEVVVSLAQRHIHRSLQLAVETVRLQKLLTAADIPVTCSRARRWNSWLMVHFAANKRGTSTYWCRRNARKRRCD